MELARFLAKVRLLAGRRSAHRPRDDGQAPKSRLPRVRRITGYLPPDDFADALMTLKGRGIGGEERLHVFSLSDFREAAGDKWTRLGALVEVAVESIIRRNIDNDTDLFTRLDSELSCLALPRTPRPEARARVGAIARDLTAHLFGDALIGGRRPQVVAANLPLREALTEDGALDREAIDKALARAGAALAALMDPTEILPADRMAPAAAGSVFAISGGMRERAPEEIFTIAATGGKGADWLDAAFDAQARPAAPEKERLDPQSSLLLVWTPTWVTNRQGIGAFQARVIRSDPGDPAPKEGVHAYAGVSPVEALTLDRFVATMAARELKTLYFGQRRTGLSVPIHWTSLAPRWRDCIRIPFEDCPPPARRKFLKIEVFGLTPDLSPLILGNLFGPLEMVGCDVLARLPLGATAMIGDLRGVKGVGVDLAELEGDDRVGDEELFERLMAFRTEARKAGLASYVWGLRRRPLIARVIRAGFSLVNGPGVMCDLGCPALPTTRRRAA